MGGVTMRYLFQNVMMVLAILVTCSISFSSQTSLDNNLSLNGVTKAYVYFDISLKEDELLVFRMNLLDRTIREMNEAGLEVTTVIGFRGGASRFITKDDHYVLEEEVENKKKIQDWIKRFSSQGITVEQGAIAAEINDIPVDDFLSEVKLVGNGYISLIGYQAQGYSVVPMD